MRNIKKTLKRTKKGRKSTRKNRYLRGGITNPFLAPSPYKFANKVDCSNMNIDVINDMKELHTRYQKCCPKTIFGYKNSSPICKKMDAKFNQLWKKENDARGYFGYDKPPTTTP